MASGRKKTAVADPAHCPICHDPEPAYGKLAPHFTGYIVPSCYCRLFTPAATPPLFAPAAEGEAS